jgi:hypothetical protein
MCVLSYLMWDYFYVVDFNFFEFEYLGEFQCKSIHTKLLKVGNDGGGGGCSQEYPSRRGLVGAKVLFVNKIPSPFN